MDLNKQTINVTQAALAYMQKMIAKEHGIALRLTIKKTGCSGFAYQPEIVHESAVLSTNHKKIAEVSDYGIYIDTNWEHLLRGITIDYVEDNKMGLKQKKLVFHNPQEESRCGCGESFHVQ